ncbi:sulfite exporter TauE/SafE family protein [Carnobacterium mobile]|uniref:sulfite exporter TauE/SafE family protein n=1 Tax=Carnobacterium mobile TaxID=2750 RepID=UPI0018678896|nr:sulfite exporter TauE/SafE family protein [Carnobacterium mobile]
MDTELILLVVGIVFLGSLMRAVFGFGDSIVSMPLLALLPINLSTSIALVGLGGFTVAVLTVLSGWKNVDRPVLKQLSIGTLVGIPVGLLLVKFAPNTVITYILGIFLIVYGMYSLVKNKIGQSKPRLWLNKPVWSLPFGFAAGMFGSAYNMNGVPIVVYGTMREWKPEVFRETLQAHFLISSSLIIIGQFMGGFWSKELLVLYGFSLPAIGIAILLGKFIYGRIPTYKFERYVFILVILLGIMLLINPA